jgi:hypothetical protein
MKSAKLMQAIYIITLHDVHDKGRQRVAPPSWEAEKGALWDHSFVREETRFGFGNAEND